MKSGIKRGGLESRKNKFGYLFTLPFIIGAVFGILYPVGVTIAYSFSALLPQDIGYKMDFVGFENYRYLFAIDPNFIQQLLSTLRDTLLKIPVAIVFSFFLACILNADFPGRGFARTILFLPLIVFSKPVTALLRGDLVSQEMATKGSEETVLVSDRFVAMLESAGIGKGLSTFLTNAVDDITNILFMSVIPTIIILAGLQSVSRSLYEASYVEGATAWEVLWKISLPMVSPLLLVSVLYCVVDSFTGVSNAVMTRVNYDCFTALNFSRGSAEAWSYLVIVLAIVGVVYAIARRFISYTN